MRRLILSGGLMVAAFSGIVLAQDNALKEIEGTYKVLALEKSGKAGPKELADSLTVTIKGDEMVIAIAGEGEKKAKIKVDGTKTPKSIDITPSEGPEKGKTFPGIYKSEKGEFTLVFTEKGDRPKDFKTENAAMLLKMKKEEKK